MSHPSHTSKKTKLKHRFRKYVGEKRPHKLLRLAEKYRCENLEYYLHKEMNRKRSGKKRSLHMFCIAGDISMVKVFLKIGADINLVDSEGNSALHCALNYALETLDCHFFQEVVLDMLNISSETLATSQNRYGETPQAMADEFLKLVMIEQERFLDCPEEESFTQTNESGWNRRLCDEIALEDPFSLEDYSLEEHTDSYHYKESFHEWGDRMGREYYNKHHHLPSKYVKPPRMKVPDPPSATLQSSSSCYISNLKKKVDLMDRRNRYEERCNFVFCADNKTKILTFRDIPWPLSSMSQGCYLSEEDKTDISTMFLFGFDGKNQIKYLRKQQVQWHPDRFQQRCKDRLNPKDQDAILNLVTELSMWINSEVKRLQSQNQD